ncbi:hypothetical protein EC915_11263 [Pseudomonas sp. LP_7_YM]|nr:hypothetical protein EC915_11263 [Pseudomonas sp. LP_7_YM]
MVKCSPQRAFSECDGLHPGENSGATSPVVLRSGGIQLARIPGVLGASCAGANSSPAALSVSSHGHNVWLEASYNPITDAHDRLYKVVKFATIITDQVNRESAVAAAASIACTSQQTDGSAQPWSSDRRGHSGTGPAHGAGGRPHWRAGQAVPADRFDHPAHQQHRGLSKLRMILESSKSRAEEYDPPARLSCFIP